MILITPALVFIRRHGFPHNVVVTFFAFFGLAGSAFGAGGTGFDPPVSGLPVQLEQCCRLAFLALPQPAQPAPLKQPGQVWTESPDTPLPPALGRPSRRGGSDSKLRRSRTGETVCLRNHSNGPEGRSRNLFAVLTLLAPGRWKK